LVVAVIVVVDVARSSASGRDTSNAIAR